MKSPPASQATEMSVAVGSDERRMVRARATLVVRVPSLAMVTVWVYMLTHTPA